MNIRHVPNQLEIYFWSSIIALMSESRFMQRCMRDAYHFKPTKKHTKLLIEGIAWSIIGLLLGFALGLLSA
jgi:hypothetical protein